jgi:hypothetical protein
VFFGTDETEFFVLETGAAATEIIAAYAPFGIRRSLDSEKTFSLVSPPVTHLAKYNLGWGLWAGRQGLSDDLLTTC